MSRHHQQSIGLRITVLLLVPFVSLLGLCGYAVGLAVRGTVGAVDLAAMITVAVVAVVVSTRLAVRLGRGLTIGLAELTRAQRELAGDRLPAMVERLRRGHTVDVAAEAPDREYGTDEVGQAGQAFAVLRRTVVRSTVEQAEFHAGGRDVVLNLARRNQALLHRQLELLDMMERRVEDPDELDRLFQIDHLATRMRRHAEDLIILSGARPGRRWRRPLPLVDVIRGAVEEVEGYVRVALDPVPAAGLVGPAAADVMHLLAELIENAVSYSPSHTTARISVEVVARGVAIEIEDRGPGMAPGMLAAANAGLQDPPEFPPSHDSARLGLFVVGRLAHRHDITVHLRTSPYGGVTAIVLIPDALVEPADDGSDERGRVEIPVPARRVEAPAPAGHVEASAPTESQDGPDQARPDEARSDQSRLEQDRLEQDRPGQARPAQIRLDQSRPDQG
ncbi:MAG: ATP-binding protein, partial [Actinocatenispora sp.]